MDGTLEERLKKLETELEALRMIKTAEDVDEGARLHAMHNAPWVKGQYSHLQFPAYQYRPFPKAMYTIGFEAARQTRALADLIPAYGINDVDRATAIVKADREITKYVRVVKSEAELRLLGRAWFESPGEAVEYERALQREIEVADAQRAHADRRMTGRAAEERDRKEENADGFVPEIPAEKLPSKTRQRIPARSVTGGQHGKAGQ